MSIVTEIFCQGYDESEPSAKTIELFRDGTVEFLDYDIDMDETHELFQNETSECLTVCRGIENSMIHSLITQGVFSGENLYKALLLMLDGIEHILEMWTSVLNEFNYVDQIFSELYLYMEKGQEEQRRKVETLIASLRTDWQSLSADKRHGAPREAFEDVTKAMLFVVQRRDMSLLAGTMESGVYEWYLLELRSAAGAYADEMSNGESMSHSERAGLIDAAKREEYYWQLDRMFDYVENEG